MNDEGHEPDESLTIVESDGYYRRRGRRGDRRDRGVMILFVIVTLIFFSGFVWLFVTGPIHH
jgi:hypothetical protein